MTNLLRMLTRPEEARTTLPLNFQDWVNYFTYQGVNYPLGGFRQTLLGDNEEPATDYGGLQSVAYRTNPIVFACCLVRALHFAEVKFQFRNTSSGRLFGTPDLRILETPWPNGTTGDLLAHMIQDADLGGNAFILRDGDRLARLRPDWVGIMLGSRYGRRDWVAGDGDTEVAGYVYWPGGHHSGNDPQSFAPSEIAHFRPVKDPDAVYRGMSWLTPLVNQVAADGAMTRHQLAFLRNGATVNLVVKFATPKQEDFDKAVARFREQHEGVANAYKTLMLGMGTEVQPVGVDLAQMEFTALQSAGELRIASAARVPPVILGLREGLSGSTLNSGNFQQSRRMLSDTMRSLWRMACGALQTIVTVPAGAELWFDERDIAFLKEDLKDMAQVQQMQGATAASLIQGGYDPQSIIDYIAADDITLLKPIPNVTTVQLQPMNINGSSNGSGGTAMPQIAPPSA